MSDDIKEFSDGFMQDIAYLLEWCMNNKTDNITITLNYGERDLEIDMDFKIHSH